MVDYVSTNALSMLGGDDYGDITADIAILDASVVHRTGNLNESINGVKTFTSDFGINNDNTNIVSSVGVTITSAANYLNGTQNRIGSSLPTASTSIGNKIDCIGGYNLMTSSTTSSIANLIEATGGASNAMITTGAGNNTLNAQGTGKNFLISQTNNNEIQAGSANLMLIGTTEKLNMTSTLTTLTNTAHTITATGLNTISSSLAGVANDISASGANSYNRIQNSGSSGQNLIIATLGTNRIASNSGLSYANQLDAYGTGGNEIKTTTGDNTITTSGGNNFMTITGGSFKENILTANANSGLANRILGFNNYLTGSDTNYLSAPKNSIVSTTTSNSTSNLIDATGTGGGNTIRTTTGQTTIVSTSGKIALSTTSTLADGVLAYNGGVGGGVTIRADGAGAVINEEVNGTHSVIISGTSRLVTNSTKTTITNTNVDVVGNLNATRYRLGTTALNKPLSSMIMGVGHCQFALPNVAAASTSNTDGTWLGGTTFFRTPDYGVFVPTFITVTYSGTFAGGALAIHRFEVINNSTGGTVIANTGNPAYTSVMTTNTLVGDTNFLSTGNFAAGNLFTVRCVINTGAAAITASTKVAYLQVYGYQLNP